MTSASSTSMDSSSTSEDSPRNDNEQKELDDQYPLEPPKQAELSLIVGSPSEHAKVRHDRRDKDRIVTYEPTHRWWTPPLRAWLYELNHEILLLLVFWNVMIALLARYTYFCGHPDGGDGLSLCDEEWVMGDDVVYNSLGVGMFLLLAFRAHEAYDRFWDGRKAWGRVKECCRDLTRQICYHIEVEEGTEQEAERSRAIGFVGAFASTLKLTLRRERNSVPELGDILCKSIWFGFEKLTSYIMVQLTVASFKLFSFCRFSRYFEY